MSIEVRGVTKIFGKQKALDDVSFSIKAGEVVSLLGPNGAGKSTLMKIISCFIPPTSGSISVNGYDVMSQSIEVRKVIGYLPENNPLYYDMYVTEYLRFIAGLHHLGQSTESRIREIIGITGLGMEKKKKVGALSKGFRQRLGLAQALIHDPPVLIMDEPTSGLDPNQLIEIRNLIMNIGKEKTVVLSTHIMQEVEAVCGRAIIIDQGKIIADDKTSRLSGKITPQDIITIEFDGKVDESLIKSIEGTESFSNPEGNIWKIIAQRGCDIRPKIFKFAVDHQLTVLSMSREEQSLERVFQELTKK